MSRAYRIALSETRLVAQADAVRARLELLPILPPERMIAHLAAALSARGFAVADGRATRGTDPAVEVELATGEVAIHLDDCALQVSAGEGTGRSDAQAERRARAALEDDAARQEDAAQRALTERLTAALPGLSDELDRVVADALGAALEEKAAQMGEIEEIVRDAAGSLSIRVRL